MQRTRVLFSSAHPLEAAAMTNAVASSTLMLADIEVADSTFPLHPDPNSAGNLAIACAGSLAVFCNVADTDKDDADDNSIAEHWGFYGATTTEARIGQILELPILSLRYILAPT